MSGKYYLGIDWGGTKIAANLVTPSRESVWRQDIPSNPGEAYETTLHRIANLIEQGYDESSVPKDSVAALGCAVAAQVRPEDGYVAGSPNIGLSKVYLKEDIFRVTGLPAVVENDVNAAALGEYGIHPSDASPFLAVFVGTGVGGGLIVDGEIYRGANGYACEIGHVPVEPLGAVCGCGARGCVEAYAGGIAMGRRALSAMEFGRAAILAENGFKGDLPNPSEIAAAARAGDDDCAAILREAIEALACGLTAAVNLFDPATVVLGGGVIEGYPDIAQQVWQRTQARILPATRGARVRLSLLGGAAAAVGAATLAIREFG